MKRVMGIIVKSLFVYYVWLGLFLLSFVLISWIMLVAISTVVPIGAEVIPYLNSTDRGCVVSPSGKNRLYFVISNAKTGHAGTYRMWVIREYLLGVKVVVRKGYVDDPFTSLPVSWDDDNTCEFCFDFNSHRESDDSKFIRYEF